MKWQYRYTVTVQWHTDSADGMTVTQWQYSDSAVTLVTVTVQMTWQLHCDSTVTQWQCSDISHSDSQWHWQCRWRDSYTVTVQRYSDNAVTLQRYSDSAVTQWQYRWHDNYTVTLQWLYNDKVTLHGELLKWTALWSCCYHVTFTPVSPSASVPVTQSSSKCHWPDPFTWLQSVTKLSFSMQAILMQLSLKAKWPLDWLTGLVRHVTLLIKVACSSNSVNTSTGYGELLQRSI